MEIGLKKAMIHAIPFNPPWCGNQDFPEYVVKNHRKVRIYNITYKGKEFRMYKEILEKIKNGVI